MRNPSDLPAEIQHVVPFEALVVAEGEASPLIRHLGFDRYVTRFGLQIGIVVNMAFDRSNAAEKKLQEFVVLRSNADWESTCLGKLAQQGVEVEAFEYLHLLSYQFEKVIIIG